MNKPLVKTLFLFSFLVAATTSALTTANETHCLYDGDECYYPSSAGSCTEASGGKLEKGFCPLKKATYICDLVKGKPKERRYIDTYSYEQRVSYKAPSQDDKNDCKLEGGYFVAKSDPTFRQYKKSKKSTREEITYVPPNSTASSSSNSGVANEKVNSSEIGNVHNLPTPDQKVVTIPPPPISTEEGPSNCGRPTIDYVVVEPQVSSGTLGGYILVDTSSTKGIKVYDEVEIVDYEQPIHLGNTTYVAMAFTPDRVGASVCPDGSPYKQNCWHTTKATRDAAMLECQQLGGKCYGIKVCDGMARVAFPADGSWAFAACGRPSKPGMSAEYYTNQTAELDRELKHLCESKSGCNCTVKEDWIQATQGYFTRIFLKNVK